MSCCSKEIYSDGIGKIHFLGGMLRLDLFSFKPSDEENDKPQPEIVQRVVMSPNAFLASYESFVNMIEKLKDAGIISTTKNEENNEASVQVEDAVETPVEAPTEAPEN